jgi:ribosomal protein S18 acetylase RimI-like enzyme
VRIRRARPDEMSACAALYVRVLTETFTWMAPDRHSTDDFLGAARDEEVYVAVDDDGLIIGLAALYRPDSFLHSLYVDDRGRGVGRALLDHICRLADGPVSLKCQTANTRAQAFYLREGFRIAGYGADPPPGTAWVRMIRETQS